MTRITNDTDLKFFTNSGNDSLYQRFVDTLKYAQFFDVLVGYFRITGFNRLYKDLEQVDKIRILVGLNVDKDTFDIIDSLGNQTQFDFESHKKIRENAEYLLVNELEHSDDTEDVELSVKKFIEFVQTGRLEVKAHPSKNIHAKVYITRYDRERMPYFGSVITGSSNFSESGLVAQREFNVELKDKPEVDFALSRFEELWSQAVDVTEEYVGTIQNKTWISNQITPYELYLKFLFEYFKENINAKDDIDFELPDSFKNLEYQKEAVLSAKKILEAYNGVFLADVVGLGKTYISALLLQRLQGRKLILCPPHLIDYWKETLSRFYVPGCVVKSIGKLEQTLEEDSDRYSVILVDEAHRFRNELTQGYELLHNICKKKKIILVSATPLNNKLADILSLIKLFQPGKQSNIPGIPDLERFFADLQRRIDQHKKGSTKYFEEVTKASAEARDKVLKYLMVRRTRTEIKKYFDKDIREQGLSFPDLGDPQRIIYSFDTETDNIFNSTIDLLIHFRYSRYTPLLYLKRGLGDFEQQQQINIGGFMKSLLVKRLESSFHAFKKTLARFIKSYEKFIEMFTSGKIYISKKIDVYELLSSDDEERISRLVEEGEVTYYETKDFRPDFLKVLEQDLQALKTIQRSWQQITSDPKLEQFVSELKTNGLLKNQVIVFSESKETIDYLYQKLNEEFGANVLAFSSKGAYWKNQHFGKDLAKDIIKRNYDPTNEEPDAEIKILLTTDILAEGINLHRSNIIINYDLPWNPTRVLQRVGRVNRVGTEHKNVYIFNFFPTAQSEAHLGLEDNIKAKIQAFHNTLGEDAKYLTEEEELSSHELFGDKLYKKLNDKNSFDLDEEVESELKYLQVIRDVRDTNPNLFEKIKRLPKKARSARKQEELQGSLITFFRKGMLKKFVISDAFKSRELTFFEAAKVLECAPTLKSEKLPRAYFDCLQRNKEFLDLSEYFDLEPSTSSRGSGSSNEQFIIRLLKSKDIRNFKGFTDDDEKYLSDVKQAFEAGSIPKKTAKRIKDSFKNNLQPLTILAVLRENLRADEVEPDIKSEKRSIYKEVILSEYFLEGVR